MRDVDNAVKRRGKKEKLDLEKSFIVRLFCIGGSKQKIISYDENFRLKREKYPHSLQRTITPLWYMGKVLS
jgi:hypothetical protein